MGGVDIYGFYLVKKRLSLAVAHVKIALQNERASTFLLLANKKSAHILLKNRRFHLLEYMSCNVRE